MRRIWLIIISLILLSLFSLCAFSAEKIEEYIYDYEAEEAKGYIVTVVKDTTGIERGDGALFSESIPDDLFGEEVVEYIEDNVYNTSPIIPEIGMMKVEDEETLNQLIEAGLVESYEPNIKMYLLGYDYTENPFFSRQWGHVAINSSYAWNAGIFGKEVRIAVIDSGVYPHNDLKNNLVEGKNYAPKEIKDSSGSVIGNEYDPTDTVDALGHGTFVAGIIAAECNNLATAGLAHRATIVPMKVCQERSVDMSYAIQAMKDAVDLFDCDVINMSLGTKKYSEELKSAVSYVISKGAIIVAAAGNDGDASYFYPASYDSVVSVANVEKSGDTFKIKSSSQQNDKVDIAAPGTEVYSLAPSATGVAHGSGTSFACPYVTASAALVKSIMPDIKQAQFEFALKNTANSSYITESQGSNYWGAGMMDVEALMKFMLNNLYDDFYLSPPDEQIYGNNTSVYLTNLNSTSSNFGSVVLYNHIGNDIGVKKLNSIRIIPAILGGDESMEISFTSNGMLGNVKYTMLSEKMKPLINPVRTVSVEE